MEPNINRAGEVGTHELAHQWHVNDFMPPMAGKHGGHCGEPSTQPPAPPNPVPRLEYVTHQLLCTMYAAADTPQFWDGVVEFHYEHTNGLIDSEYQDIRTQADPIIQEGPK